MNREKAIRNRNEASRLMALWRVDAADVKYRETGNWYQLLKRFPAALFDANGFVRFETEVECRSSPYLRIGKQVGVPGGIAAMPTYVRMRESAGPDVDIHEPEANEGERRLVSHLRRERDPAISRLKKSRAKSLDCEACGFSFGRAYGDAAKEYCEVHHVLPLSGVETSTTTRLKDLAILCANCHRVVHRRNPPYALEEVKKMLATRRVP